MFRFTGKEIRDLIISFIVIALGFTILYSNGDYSHVTNMSYGLQVCSLHW